MQFYGAELAFPAAGALRNICVESSRSGGTGGVVGLLTCFTGGGHVAAGLSVQAPLSHWFIKYRGGDAKCRWRDQEATYLGSNWIRVVLETLNGMADREGWVPTHSVVLSDSARYLDTLDFI